MADEPAVVCVADTAQPRAQPDGGQHRSRRYADCSLCKLWCGWWQQVEEGSKPCRFTLSVVPSHNASLKLSCALQGACTWTCPLQALRSQLTSCNRTRRATSCEPPPVPSSWRHWPGVWWVSGPLSPVRHPTTFRRLPMHVSGQYGPRGQRGFASLHRGCSCALPPSPGPQAGTFSRD